MKEINNGYFTGERSLFNSEDIKINNTIFGEGESPLKESDNIEPVSYTHLTLPTT